MLIARGYRVTMKSYSLQNTHCWNFVDFMPLSVQERVILFEEAQREAYITKSRLKRRGKSLLRRGRQQKGHSFLVKVEERNQSQWVEA